MTQLIFALLALGLPGPSLTAQEDVPASEAKFIYSAPLKFVRGEVIEFEETRSIPVSGRMIPSESAVLLQTAIAGRILAQFPAGQAPELHLNEEVYPVFRQGSSNWDMKAERPINLDEPVAEVEWLYFLIPTSLAENIVAGARAVLRTKAPPSFSQGRLPVPGESLPAQPGTLDLMEVPGSLEFLPEIVVRD